MTEIVLASSNPGKIREVKELLEKVNIRLISLDETGFSGEIPETGETIKDNALEKAWFIARRFPVNVLADDTGLEVEALNGAPGVYSARYAGEEKSDARNMEKLLENLQGVENRRAAFTTWLALIIDGKEYTFKGEVSGKITHQLSGNKGFGYDPVFTPDGFEKTFAEMSSEDKNSISHRGKALQKLIAFLKDRS